MSEERDDFYNQIHKYLDGELNAAERVAFERRIAADPELADAVKLEQELQMLVRYERRMELKNMLRNIPTNQGMDEGADESNNQSESKNRPAVRPPKASKGGIRPPFWRYAFRMGGVAAILIAAFALFFLKGRVGLADMAKTYDISPDLFLSESTEPARGAAMTTLDSIYSVARDLIIVKQYTDALSILGAQPEQDSIQFLTAIALRGDGKDSIAYDVFQKSLKLPSNEFKGQVLWCLLMIDLRNGDVTAAKLHSKALVDARGYKSKEATEIREKLGWDDESADPEDQSDKQKKPISPEEDISKTSVD